MPGFGFGRGRRRAAAAAASVLAAIRIAPVSADLAYVVSRSAWGTALAFRFQRNLGGASSADVGAPWQMWRITGVYELAAFADDPETQRIFVLGDDQGAWDHTIQRGTIFKNGFSYHGGQVLNSSSIKVDGVVVGFGAAVSGAAFELAHTSTVTFSDATTASDVFTLAIGENGLITETKSMTMAAAAASETYPQMWIAATGFTEAFAGANAATNITANADYPFGTSGDVTLRSPTTGHTVRNVSNAPAITGYQSTFVRRATLGAGQRSKLYYKRGSTSGAALGTMSCSRTVAFSKT